MTRKYGYAYYSKKAPVTAQNHFHILTQVTRFQAKPGFFAATLAMSAAVFLAASPIKPFTNPPFLVDILKFR
jgi:hypothetical protein